MLEVLVVWIVPEPTSLFFDFVTLQSLFAIPDAHIRAPTLEVCQQWQTRVKIRQNWCTPILALNQHWGHHDRVKLICIFTLGLNEGGKKTLTHLSVSLSVQLSLCVQLSDSPSAPVCLSACPTVCLLLSGVLSVRQCWAPSASVNIQTEQDEESWDDNFSNVSDVNVSVGRRCIYSICSNKNTAKYDEFEQKCDVIKKTLSKNKGREKVSARRV